MSETKFQAFLVKRLINDVKRDQVKYLDSEKFLGLCYLYYTKQINNLQFKKLLPLVCLKKNTKN